MWREGGVDTRKPDGRTEINSSSASYFSSRRSGLGGDRRK